MARADFVALRYTVSLTILGDASEAVARFDSVATTKSMLLAVDFISVMSASSSTSDDVASSSIISTSDSVALSASATVVVSSLSTLVSFVWFSLVSSALGFAVLSPAASLEPSSADSGSRSSPVQEGLANKRALCYNLDSQ